MGDTVSDKMNFLGTMLGDGAAPAPAAPAATVGTWPMVPAHPAPDGGGGFINMSDEHWGRFMRGESPTVGNAAAEGAGVGTPGPAAPAPAAAVGGAAAPLPVPGGAGEAATPALDETMSRLRTEAGTPAAPAATYNTPGLAEKMRVLGQGTEGPIPPDVDPNYPVSPGQTTGMLANIGAGTAESVSGLLGMPVDALTSAINAPIKLGYGAADMAARALGLGPIGPAPQITNPIGGSHSINQLFGVVGANPENVAPANMGEKLARVATQGAVSTVLPGGTAARMMKAAGPTSHVVEGAKVALPASPMAPAIGAVAQSAGALQGTAGAIGGVAGEFAAEVVPDQFKDAARLVGNIGGGAATLGAAVPMAAGGRMAGGLMEHVTAPMGIGRKVELPFTDDKGKPIKGTAAQMRIAGQRLQSALGDTEIPAPDPNVIGQHTIGQTTGNKDVLSYERALRTKNRAPFNAQEERNNKARADALAGIADPEASETAAQDFVLRRLHELEAIPAEEAAAAAGARASTAALPATPASTTGAQMGEQVARAQSPAIGRSEAALSQAETDLAAAETAIGGDASMRAADVGSRAQRALAAIDNAHDENVNRLSDLIDPNGQLVADNSPIIARAKAMKKLEASRPMRKAPEGETADIIDMAEGMEAASPFRDLRDLRSRITTELRVQRRAPDGELNVARLSQLLGSVDESFAAAAGAQAAKDSAAVAAGALAPENTVGGRLAADAVNNPLPPTGVPLGPVKIYTPSGTAIDVEYKVVDGDSLVTSHNDNLDVNPKFPAELQPRDRERAASALQVHNIAAKLIPEKVGASPSPMEGAPVIGPDNVVEAGNGRTIGIMRALRAGGVPAEQYRAYINGLGYDTTGMKNPVLVRQRTSALTPEERVKFTQEGNANAGLGMSAPEVAAVDAQRLGESTLSLWRGGDINSDRNIPFVRAFIANVLDKGAEGDVVTVDGALSKSGLVRVENALLAKAYGSDDLINALTEGTDENIKAFAGALRDASPEVAQLADDVAAGRAAPDLAIGDHLAEAARLIGGARRMRVSLTDVLGQQDMLGGGASPLASQVLRWAYGPALRGRMNRAKIADGLRFYAQEAREQSGLFGAKESAGDLLARAEQKYGGQSNATTGPRGPGADATQGGAGASAPRGAGGNVQGDGAGGAEARGPGPGADRPAGTENRPDGASPPAEAGGVANGPGVLPKPKLTPNITETDVAAYQDMRDAFRTRMETMHEGAVGDVLQSGPTKGTFKMEAERVAPALFNSGGSPAADVQSFMRAVGGATEEDARFSLRALAVNPETGAFDPARMDALLGMRRQAIDAVERSAAFSLRDAATSADGALNATKARAWIKDHAAALDAFPSLRQKFTNLADLGQRLTDLKAERKALDADYPLARLGTNADVTAKYIQPGPRGGARVQQYMRDTNNSPDAARVLDDGLLSSLRESAMRGEEWNAPAYENWMKRHASALGERPELAEQVKTLGEAQNAVAEAATRRQDDIKAYQSSAAGHYMTKAGELVDPQHAIASLMRSPTSSRDAAHLVASMRNDPVALAGLRRNAVDWVLNRVRGATESGTSGEMQLKSARLQKDLQDPKTRRTLEAMFDKEQLDVLDGVAHSMMLEGRAVSGVRIPGTSQTAADLAGMDHTEPQSVLMQGLIGERAVDMALHMAEHTGGTTGLMMRSAGVVAGVLHASMRMFGLRTINDIATYGVLQPELGRLLLQNAVSDPKASIFDRFKQRLGAFVATGAAANQDKHRSGQ